MTLDCGKPFESIESAHDFVGLLAETVREARQEIEAEAGKGAESEAGRRRREALRIAAYSLAKLEDHVSRSSRILNDLRSLRRLLNEERAPKAAKAAAQSQTGKAATTAAVPQTPVVPAIVRDGGRQLPAAPMSRRVAA